MLGIVDVSFYGTGSLQPFQRGNDGNRCRDLQIPCHSWEDLQRQRSKT